MDKIQCLSEKKSFEILHTQNELEKKKKTYNSVNLSKLPDKGAKLKYQIEELENTLKALTIDADLMKNKKDVTVAGDQSHEVTKSESKLLKEDPKKEGICKDTVLKENMPFCNNIKNSNMLSFSDFTPTKSTKNVDDKLMDSPSFKTWRGKEKVSKTILTEAKPLIEQHKISKAPSYHCSNTNFLLPTNEECVKKMHTSFLTFPDDSVEENEPDNLKAVLMMHQRRGLAWLLWREEQDPFGGILADDMGLGKTLTMISLILKQKEKLNYFSHNEDNLECRGTLIVCLASIIHQWREEIFKHCEKNALRVMLYHGPQRERDHKKMMDYDVILTTYNIVMSERKAVDVNKKESPLFKLKWERIILDEAHTIKNPQSQTAKAVFSLRSFRKWSVTGTPIHNIFKDMYSLIKFLQFSPFDEYKKFKELTEESSERGEQLRNLLVKSIVLRRTKDQIDEWGKPLIEMKSKSILITYIELTAEERKVYDKLNEKVTKKFYQYLEKSTKMKSSSLLVLLLRLQQCCNHLSLLDKAAEEDDVFSDITDTLSGLTIKDTVSDSNSSESNIDITFEESESENLRDISIKSSKIKVLFSELKKIFESLDNTNKCVIVSQWVSMLNVVAHHLNEEKIGYHFIEGGTKVEDRQKFANDFNHNEKGAKVMLLSLKAGGVGLNLSGANHLFLLDLHWNPALEMQACDRIHRVGQKKDVFIHKFICKDTIEEKISLLQDEKRRLAKNVLHGVKQNTKSLSIDDFKALFIVKKY